MENQAAHEIKAAAQSKNGMLSPAKEDKALVKAARYDYDIGNE